MSCAVSGRGLFVVLAEHAQDGGRGGLLALLLACGNYEAGGDVAQAQLLPAQVEGHGEHGVVGDGGAADGLAAGAGRLVAFQGAVADVLALHPRQRGEHGEHDSGRVVRALRLAGQEFQPDVAGLQLLGQRRELDAAAEPLVLVHDDRDRGPGRAQLPGQGDGLVELGAADATRIFLEKIRVAPEARSESVWVSSDWRTVEARAYPIRTCPAGPAPAATGRGSSTRAEPGLRSAGTGTLRAFARWGTRRNRAVWYWTATRPRPVRHGEPAWAAQEEIGQSPASTRRKSVAPARLPKAGSLSNLSAGTRF